MTIRYRPKSKNYDPVFSTDVVEMLGPNAGDIIVDMKCCDAPEYRPLAAIFGPRGFCVICGTRYANDKPTNEMKLEMTPEQIRSMPFWSDGEELATKRENYIDGTKH